MLLLLFSKRKSLLSHHYIQNVFHSSYDRSTRFVYRSSPLHHLRDYSFLVFVIHRVQIKRSRDPPRQVPVTTPSSESQTSIRCRLRRYFRRGCRFRTRLHYSRPFTYGWTQLHPIKIHRDTIKYSDSISTLNFRCDPYSLIERL